MSFDWRKGGQFVSQTHRYMSEDKMGGHWLDQLIHPGGRTGKELRDWLVALGVPSASILTTPGSAYQEQLQLLVRPRESQG